MKLEALAQVKCPVCRLVQLYRNQKRCIHNGCDLKSPKVYPLGLFLFNDLD